MIRVRGAGQRGHFDYGWLDTYHSFSFGDYVDPRHMGFRAMRVLNEDRIQPGQGFPEHSHRDMEILTWIVAGTLRHEDSMGNGSILRAGEAQRMSAGKGVSHRELNPSTSEVCHLLQVWILPERTGYLPSYQQKHFALEERSDRLQLVASRDARSGSLAIHADVDVYAARLAQGGMLVHRPPRGRHAWLQVVCGRLTLAGTELAAGAGAAASDEPALEIRAKEPAEFLLFDLA
jgi:hypothetical protein